MNKEQAKAVRRLIKGALKIFEAPRSWRRFANSRNAAGNPTDSVLDKDAVSFCMRGAVMRAAGVSSQSHEKVVPTIDFLKERGHAEFGEHVSLVGVNDGKMKDKRSVIAFLKRALKNLDA